ncbi:MAG: hypothetical protein DMG69_03965 [Acidobacteria bacterium]|nr:MAG: hypothetical protein DMG69_03965 [Acidobacteriota bacterium]
MNFADTMAIDAKRGWNSLLWAGFVLSVIAFLSYFSVFVEFPSTRDSPWPTCCFARYPRKGIGLNTVLTATLRTVNPRPQQLRLTFPKNSRFIGSPRAGASPWQQAQRRYL